MNTRLAYQATDLELNRRKGVAQAHTLQALYAESRRRYTWPELGGAPPPRQTRIGLYRGSSSSDHNRTELK